MTSQTTTAEARVAVLVDCDNTSKPIPKHRPKALIHAVTLLAADTPDGRVGLGALGQYLKRTDPGFSPKAFGHSALSDMVRTYPDLAMTHENGSGFWVQLRPKAEATDG